LSLPRLAALVTTALLVLAVADACSSRSTTNSQSRADANASARVTAKIAHYGTDVHCQRAGRSRYRCTYVRNRRCHIVDERVTPKQLYPEWAGIAATDVCHEGRLPGTTDPHAGPAKAAELLTAGARRDAWQPYLRRSSEATSCSRYPREPAPVDYLCLVRNGRGGSILVHVNATAVLAIWPVG
jgi:hypothetical protein